MNAAYLIGGLGDTVVAVPALRAIRERWPEHPLLLLYNSDGTGRVTARDVLQDSGLVDEFLPYNAAGGVAEALAVLRHLRAQPLETAIYLAPALRSRPAIFRDRCFFRMAGASKLVGFVPSPRGVPEMEARLARLQIAGVPISDAARAVPCLEPSPRATASVTSWLDARRAPGRRPLIAFSPGSQMPAKLWPLERFAEIGRRLAGAFCVDRVVVGGPAEQRAGGRLISAWGGGMNAAGAFSVPETTALLNMADLLITLDTGAMHVAAALGTPCVALFSAIDEEGKWDPVGSNHTLLRKRVACGGCRRTTCPLPEHPCMTGIAVDEVWEAVLARSGEWKGAH